MSKDNVKIAVIGLGNISNMHLKNIAKAEGVDLAAVCDMDVEKAKKVAGEHDCRWYDDYKKLLAERVCDAVMITTPHYSHTYIGIDSLKAGCHVLVEKPISVHKADCERLIAAHTDKNLVFAAMFNQRTDPKYKMARELISSGRLGEIVRVNWVITDWFRTEKYYSGGSWRATWKGEGGGVLLNQCPHQLDMLQWLCGMPEKVRGFCHFGRRHNIEVEDEVTAYMEFANGATGVFIASTGEGPGSNMLEICGDNGKIVMEGNRVEFFENAISSSEHCKSSEDGFGGPSLKEPMCVYKFSGAGGQHFEVLQNFIDAIISGEKLIAPAEEGINSVELANAMIYSSLEERVISLPLDAGAYEAKLMELIERSDR